MKFLAVLAALVVCSQGKVYERCELARELVNIHGFPRADIGDWICLIQHESSYNTRATNINSNNSEDYGLYQINDYYWCSGGPTGDTYNDCNVRCSNLIDDAIADDCDCAMLIYNRQGFDAWYGWKNFCKGNDNEAEYAADCF